MAATLGSKVDFESRTALIGMAPASITAFVTSGINSMARLAFSCAHQFGCSDDASLIKVLRDARGTEPSINDKVTSLKNMMVLAPILPRLMLKGPGCYTAAGIGKATSRQAIGNGVATWSSATGDGVATSSSGTGDGFAIPRPATGDGDATSTSATGDGFATSSSGTGDGFATP